MINQPTMTVTGNVTRDPERRVSKQSGNDFAVVPIAVNRRTFDRSQETWVTSDTMYVDLLAYGRAGATALASFKKGDPVLAHGRVGLREWQTDTSSGTRLVVDVDSIGHDVSWGVSRFSKGWVSYEQDRMADYDPSPSDGLVSAVDQRTQHDQDGRGGTPDGQPDEVDAGSDQGPDIQVDQDGVVQDDQQADEVLTASG